VTDAAVELAGFFAAHAVWCVCEGETLIPILAFRDHDGEQQFRRLEGARLEDSVARGQQWLADNPEHTGCAALVYDGFITLASGRTDAVVLDVREYESSAGELRIVVPYRHAGASGRFAVHRPKFLDTARPAAEVRALAEAFWRGVGKHEKGSAVWNEHLDERV
jgi:hypothetical protein